MSSSNDKTSVARVIFEVTDNGVVTRVENCNDMAVEKVATVAQCMYTTANKLSNNAAIKRFKLAQVDYNNRVLH